MVYLVMFEEHPTWIHVQLVDGSHFEVCPSKEYLIHDGFFGN